MHGPIRMHMGFSEINAGIWAEAHYDMYITSKNKQYLPNKAGELELESLAGTDTL